jgi:hypothetical protein
VSLVDTNDSWLTNSHLVVSSVGNGVVSSFNWSDGLSSSVHEPPLLIIPWLMVLDSESVVVVTDVLMPEEGSSGGHLRSQLEPNVVTEDWSVVTGTNLIQSPCLVEVIVAVPEGNVSVVMIVFTMNIKALSSVVLDVSSASIVPSDSLVDRTIVLLDVGSDSNSPVSSSLVRDGISSSCPGSNGLGSSVEGPPLFLV